MRPDSEQPTTAPPARERILLAAKSLFADGGFENTSTMSIARGAQTSESQILKHFGSKEGLLEAIFEDGWRRIGEAYGTLAYLPSPGAKLQALVGLVLSRLEEDEQLKKLFLMEGRRIRKEGHMILITHGYRDLIKLIDGLLKEMHDLGQLRDDLNLQAMRSALVGMIEGLMRDRMLATLTDYPAAFNSDEIRRVFLHVLQSFASFPVKVIGAKNQA